MRILRIVLATAPLLACGPDRSAEAIDSTLRVTFQQHGARLSSGRIEVTVDEGARPRLLSRTLGVPSDTGSVNRVVVVLGHSIPLEGSDTLALTIRLLRDADTLVTQRVSAPIRPQSYYGLELALGRADPWWKGMCAPAFTGIPVRGSAGDTLFFSFSGSRRDVIC